MMNQSNLHISRWVLDRFRISLDLASISNILELINGPLV